jgi:toxin-antitoxin system PIN domain toxin
VTHLLDGNMLVALVVSDHVHHQAAATWFGKARSFATCPITQGTLLRLLLRAGASTSDARSVLTGVTRQKRHEFWADDLDYGDVDLSRVIGHRQVIDAYLAQLARARGARLATFDHGLGVAHADVVDVVDTA